MKKIPKTIITIAALLLLLGSCKKKEVDIRNQYVGDWDFTTIVYTWLGEYGSKYDTIIYSGFINLEHTDRTLKIEHRKSIIIIVNVSELGEISYPEDSGHDHNYCYGQFNGKNKVYIEYRTGGLGGYNISYINGIKKKGGKK